MTKPYQPQLAGIGLTDAQYLVMLVRWEQHDVTVSALGARLFSQCHQVCCRHSEMANTSGPAPPPAQVFPDCRRQPFGLRSGHDDY